MLRSSCQGKQRGSPGKAVEYSPAATGYQVITDHASEEAGRESVLPKKGVETRIYKQEFIQNIS